MTSKVLKPPQRNVDRDATSGNTSRVETKAERNRQIVEDAKAAMKAGPSPYADVIRKREADAAEYHAEALRNPPPHDLNWLLGVWGPYFVPQGPEGNVTDAEIFERLDEFGLAIWEVESPSERSFARGTWIDWLKTNLIGMSEPKPSFPALQFDQILWPSKTQERWPPLSGFCLLYVPFWPPWRRYRSRSLD